MGEHNSDVCRFCGASLLDAEIPAASRHLYGAGTTHFRREIGVESEGYDGVLYYVCPDCHRAWPRFTGAGRPAGWGPSRLAALSATAVQAHEESRALLADVEAVADTLTTHAEAVAFAMAMAGLRWTGWAVEPRVGASLYLLIEGTSLVDPSEVMRLFDQSQSLCRDITGLPAVVMAAQAPAVQDFPAGVVRPVPTP